MGIHWNSLGAGVNSLEFIARRCGPIGTPATGRVRQGGLIGHRCGFIGRQCGFIEIRWAPVGIHCNSLGASVNALAFIARRCGPIGTPVTGRGRQGGLIGHRCGPIGRRWGFIGIHWAPV